MKLFTYYTPSHERMYREFMRPSVERFDEYEIVAGTGPQLCEGGFHSPGFREASAAKFEWMLKTVDWESNEMALFSDADVVFLAPTRLYLLDQIGGYDIALQNENGNCCTGFYVFCCRPAVKRVLEASLAVISKFHNEQDAFNTVKSIVHWKMMTTRIWNLSAAGRYGWSDGPVGVPPDALAFHANYVMGCGNKERVLEAVLKGS